MLSFFYVPCALRRSTVSHLVEVAFLHSTKFTMDSNRKPLSLSELKEKHEAQQRAAAKAVYVDKKNRQQAALERLRERRRRESTLQSGTHATRHESNTRSNLRSGATSQKRPRSSRYEEDDISGRSREQLQVSKTKPTRESGRKKAEKRFKFEWDAEEDTTAMEENWREEILRMSEKSRMKKQNRGMTETDLLRKRLTKKTEYLRDARHWSQKSRSEMTDRDWRIFREDFMISVRGGRSVPKPARDWSETGLPGDLLGLIATVARYNKPTAIQMAAIPIGLEGRDFIGLAETGSGKTAAFVLPMIVHITQKPVMTAEIAARGPYALILAPTRELALQIDVEARKFAEPSGYRVVHVIGGQGLDEQVGLLGAGCEIVVCTPGRMVDLLGRQMAVLGNCQYLILDEADRMVDMGFEPQLTEILDAMPSETERQTFMFSATMSPSVERIARNYLNDPVVVSVGEIGKTADNVFQRVEYFTTENKKRERFIDLMESLEAPILVFCNTKGGCEMISRYVEANSHVRPVVMHSGKSQAQRERTLDGFKTGKYKVLIATDVVGRGIDIKGVRHVVNFELPKTIEAYTHRIGRTGRAGMKGTAWSLATEADTDLFGPLSRLLDKAGAHIPRELLKGVAGKGASGFRPIID